MTLHSLCTLSFTHKFVRWGLDSFRVPSIPGATIHVYYLWFIVDVTPCEEVWKVINCGYNVTSSWFCLMTSEWWKGTFLKAWTTLSEDYSKCQVFRYIHSFIYLFYFHISHLGTYHGNWKRHATENKKFCNIFK